MLALILSRSQDPIGGSEHTGSGNDYHGTEFYIGTRILYGSIIIDGQNYGNPKPTSIRTDPQPPRQLQ
ncbi:MAG: hypothetical protein ACI9NC_000690 [Verrucomicrobiales bacterium]|jgi:hypothetical protein